MFAYILLLKCRYMSPLSGADGTKAACSRATMTSAAGALSSISYTRHGACRLEDDEEWKWSLPQSFQIYEESKFFLKIYENLNHFVLTIYEHRRNIYDCFWICTDIYETFDFFEHLRKSTKHLRHVWKSKTYLRFVEHLRKYTKKSTMYLKFY